MFDSYVLRVGSKEGRKIKKNKSKLKFLLASIQRKGSILRPVEACPQLYREVGLSTSLASVGVSALCSLALGRMVNGVGRFSLGSPAQ